MASWQFPAELASWIAALAQLLDARVRHQLSLMFCGLLFARGRRTVTSWLRAVGVRCHYEERYYFLGSLGRKRETVAGGVLRLIAHQLPIGQRVLLALDDTPTKRYGPKVEGAGIHHNPTPGPADQKFLYGHVWVTLAWLVRHPQWGTIALPLAARLYVRAQDMFLLRVLHGWTFRTKLELAAGLLEWAAGWLKYLGKTVWVATRRVCQAAVFAAREGGWRDGRESLAQGRRVVQCACRTASRPAPPRPTAQVRRAADRFGQTGRAVAQLAGRGIHTVWQASHDAIQDIPGHVPAGWRLDSRGAGEE